MEIEAYVLVSPDMKEPAIATSRPWFSHTGKWYKLTATVPDPVPTTEVRAVAEEVNSMVVKG